ncbi:hypothetical protein RCZ04_09300 [Capnocytophaga sp. HP1101]
MPLSANQEQFKEANGYFWQFNKNTAVGLSYGFKGAGIGISYEKTAQGIKHLTDFDVAERATTYGFFGNYWVTVVGGQAYEGKRDGATFNFRNANDYTKAFTKTIHTANLLPDMNTATSTEEIVSFAGILDNGNGEFFSGMIVSDYKDVQVAQGSSTGKIHNPDVVYVGVFNKDLNLVRHYKSDKLSYSAGRFKSQYLLEIGKADNGDVYVFSGAIAKNPPAVKAPQTPDAPSTKPAGALRIKPNATDFDSSYFFDISAKSNDGIFRRVWHITGNKFLLEFFNDASKAALNVVDVNRFAIVDMEAQTFNWVSGLPAPTDFANMTSNPVEPAIYNGKVYLPVNIKSGDPAIYIIDPATNAATKGLVVKGASFINAIGRL